MNTGLDQSSGASWKSFHVDDGYSGVIGGPSGYLQIKCVDELIFEGIQDAYIDCSSLALPYVKVRSDGTIKGLHLKCGTAGSNCDILWIQKGNVWVEAGTVAKGFMESWGAIAGDARLTLNAGTITLLEKQGGILTMNGGVLTTLNNRTGTSHINDGTLTNLDMCAGVVNWKTVVAALADGKIWGGLFDASGDPRAKTLTHIEMHGDADVDIDNGKGNITLTDGGVYVYGRNVPRIGAVEIGPLTGVPI